MEAKDHPEWETRKSIGLTFTHTGRIPQNQRRNRGTGNFEQRKVVVVVAKLDRLFARVDVPVGEHVPPTIPTARIVAVARENNFASRVVLGSSTLYSSLPPDCLTRSSTTVSPSIGPLKDA